MSNKSLLGSESHFANLGGWKAGSPTSNPLLLKAESWQVFLGLQQSHTTIVTNLGHHNCVTKPSASLHETGFFPQLQRRDGNDATIMQGWSGDLDFTKGMDSLDKHVWKISFRQCVTLSELGSWKAGSPASNPLLLKAESWQVFLSLQQSHTTIVTNLGHHNCVTKPSASLHETGFFAQLQRRDGNDATIMQNC